MSLEAKELLTRYERSGPYQPFFDTLTRYANPSKTLISADFDGSPGLVIPSLDLTSGSVFLTGPHKNKKKGLRAEVYAFDLNRLFRVLEYQRERRIRACSFFVLLDMGSESPELYERYPEAIVIFGRMPTVETEGTRWAKRFYKTYMENEAMILRAKIGSEVLDRDQEPQELGPQGLPYGWIDEVVRYSEARLIGRPVEAPNFLAR